MLKFAAMLFFLFVASSTQAFDISCQKAWAEMSDEYPKLVCDGDRLMFEGRYSKALEIYEGAARLDFFESPNFIIYLKIARAQCALGQLKSCAHTLADFESMLDVYVGKKTCPESEGKTKISQLTKRVINVMCGEILLDSYILKPNEVRVNSMLELEKSYRRQVKVLRSQHKIIKNHQ